MSDALTTSRRRREHLVAGDRVGITIIDDVANLLDPVVVAEAGASGQVGPLVELVAGATGRLAEVVLAALEDNFPHTFDVLLALPLE